MDLEGLGFGRWRFVVLMVAALIFLGGATAAWRIRGTYPFETLRQEFIAYGRCIPPMQHLYHDLAGREDRLWP